MRQNYFFKQCLLCSNLIDHRFLVLFPQNSISAKRLDVLKLTSMGGAPTPNDGPLSMGNPAYKLALQNLDGDMPKYITHNNNDELSHAAFLNAYLTANGAQPVNRNQFRNLPGSTATGVDKTKPWQGSRPSRPMGSSRAKARVS